jgi:putative selenium metabolism protein SsnA
MPGLVNAQTHAYSALVRGFGKAAPALDFQQQLENLWWRLDKSLSLADCYHSTRVLALDSIRHGTTTVIDHHASPLAVRGSLRELARALDETGLRACLCYELSDRDGEKSLQEGIAENLEMIEHCRKHPSDRLTALFGMHASFTLSEATLRQVSQACQGQSIGFHIHVAEALSDQLATFKLSGRRVVKRLADWGILGPRTIAAHAVHLDADEIGLLSQSDTMVVHNPQSNQNNAVGIADVLALLRQQILVGLGTDAMTANMLEELRAALFGQHLKQNHPTCAFGEVLGLLVENNYRIVERLFGIQAGKIKPGYVGDCILFDYDPPTPLDATTWAGHLIFGLSQTPVDSTIVGGRVLMRERVLAPELNEKETLRQARQHAQAMWQRFQPK